jgi:N-acetyl-1-D-myo-inositol-2-amino-2-deoxy-alpha-D-glucopyranoside deacetylase
MLRPSLLALFAHPDDEAFSCGGTLAAATSRRIDVTVVCATRGEGGWAHDASPETDLAIRRSDELARSCRALGAKPPCFLDFADGKLVARREALGERLGRLLRDSKPGAVITMGPDGAYGHLDHVVCSEVLAERVVEIVDPPTVLHTVFPSGLFDTVRRRLVRIDVPLAASNGPAPSADYVVDIRAFERQKLASIAAHRSQLRDGDPRSFLIPGIVDRLLAEELFRHASGPELRGPLAELFVAR